jgi:hypothetical protein
MTTTAKQSSSSTDVRGGSPASSSFEADEDIESIAKQISDHAEAIYQEWKARGLAPTEILKCHPDTDNSFNRTLSPKSSPTTPNSSTSSRTILDGQPISPELQGAESLQQQSQALGELIRQRGQGAHRSPEK